MHLLAADKAAKELINKHLPRHWRWKLQYHNSICTWGWCRPIDQIISLSRPLILINSTRLLREVVLHEIAHAIVDRQHGNQGHNPIWQEMAIKLGSSGKRLVEHTIDPPDRFVGFCNLCRRSTTANQRYASCKVCAIWSDSGEMSWDKHPFWESLPK